MDKTYNVLFICTGNSARSIIAEGLLNELGQGRFKAFSAGSHPKGAVHPLALKTLAMHRIPTDGFRSKSWAEFCATRRARAALRLHGMRPGRWRGVPSVAWPAHDCALGHARSRGRRGRRASA